VEERDFKLLSAGEQDYANAPKRAALGIVDATGADMRCATAITHGRCL
jgi:hypothetical protein